MFKVNRSRIKPSVSEFALSDCPMLSGLVESLPSGAGECVTRC